MNDPKRILIVGIGVPLLLWLGFIIKGAIDSGGEANARRYNTAIQASDADHFNYAIDSRQGLLLGEGDLTADQPVKFPEMNKSFAFVDKIKETYEMHTREVCTEDADGNESCHTETYYEWDFAGSEEKATDTMSLFGRKYPFALFGTDDFKYGADACDFTAPNTAGFFQQKNGCDGRYFYTDSETRFYYRVIDTGFHASLVADVTEGTLGSVTGKYVHLKKSSIEQFIKEANDYHLGGNVFIVMWFILVLGGAGFAAYAWSMQDGIFKS